MPPLINLAGKKFGKLTVLRRADGPGAPRWVCRCECGNPKTVRGNHLRSGAITSCGCQGGVFVDLTGRVFGHLTVVKRLPSISGTTIWFCRCACGKTIAVRAGQPSKRQYPVMWLFRSRGHNPSPSDRFGRTSVRATYGHQAR